MKLKTILLTAFITLTLSLGSWAQISEQQVQKAVAALRIAVQQTEMGAYMSQQMMGMAQQTGNGQEYQLAQMELQMHQQMRQGAMQLLQNPSVLRNPQVYQQAEAAMAEYLYRKATRDMRPYDQIQGQMRTYNAWAASPQGQAAAQASHQATMNQIQGNTAAMTAGHNARMSNMQNQAAAHNAHMQNLQGQYDAHNAAWSQQQQQNGVRHQQNVHAIYNEYQYQDPTNGQTYWVPMSNQAPVVVHPNGNYTPLQPYHNY